MHMGSWVWVDVHICLGMYEWIALNLRACFSVLSAEINVAVGERLSMKGRAVKGSKEQADAVRNAVCPVTHTAKEENPASSLTMSIFGIGLVNSVTIPRPPAIFTCWRLVRFILSRDTRTHKPMTLYESRLRRHSKAPLSRSLTMLYLCLTPPDTMK